MPKRPEGHRSIRLYGRKGERSLVLEVLTFNYVRTLKISDGLRASADREDLRTTPMHARGCGNGWATEAAGGSGDTIL